METKITFQVVNGNTGFEERNIEFHKLDIAKQYAIRNGFTHIHEYHGGCFEMAYDVENMMVEHSTNIQKELLTIEFRYHDRPKGEWDSGHPSKTITISVFDTLEEAIKEGNEALKVLSEHFQIRGDDRFEAHGLFGNPRRLVTNCSYPTNGIQYFASITPLKFDDLSNIIKETFDAYERYKSYKEDEI